MREVKDFIHFNLDALHELKSSGLTLEGYSQFIIYTEEMLVSIHQMIEKAEMDQVYIPEEK